MGFISRFLGSEQKLAKKLTEKYARVLLGANMDEEQAIDESMGVVEIAMNEMRKSKRRTPPNYAKNIINGRGFRNAKKIRTWLKKEGVIDEDILWWNNLPELEKWVRIKFDEYQIERARKFFKMKDHSEEDIEMGIVSLFPIFDFIDEIGESTFPNRALPHELRKRVEKWIRARRVEGTTDFWTIIHKESSMNAAIRYQIDQRLL